MTDNLTIDFSKIREHCEVQARTEAFEQKREEVTLDRIYKIIEEEYEIKEDIIEKLKQKEIELELKFCKKRETAYALYKLAKYIGKRVICTSDMYLPKKTIKEILQKNGYDKIDNIYLSCEIMKTKATGSLYEHVIEKENIEAEEIIHIGDNYKTDFGFYLNCFDKFYLKSINFIKFFIIKKFKVLFIKHYNTSKFIFF